ncbi:MAG: sugar ABC transporter permease, partial [Deltaproteobacteria bacterium]|nr:sugar ABC transporter permease [Deltaproteobacteria bacterium]
LFPALYNLGIAFYDYSPASNSWKFIGLQNFAKLWSSPFFWNSFTVTLLWVAGHVGLHLIAGLALALALNSIVRFRAVFSGILLIPWISSFVVVAILFLWIYHPQLGVLNDILLRLGVVEKPIAWLASPGLAQLSLILANTWKFFPLVMITLFAGLQDVSSELLEATQVDGANRLETFRMVIFPTILPSISTAVLLSTIWAYNSFTLPIIMTGGGPLRATEIFGLYIFKLAFDAFDFGAAAAASLILFLQILLIIVLYLRIVEREKGVS